MHGEQVYAYVHTTNAPKIEHCGTDDTVSNTLRRKHEIQQQYTSTMLYGSSAGAASSSGGQRSQYSYAYVYLCAYIPVGVY
jgi:hypothetical protein